MLSFIHLISYSEFTSFILFWRYSEQTYVSTYPRHSYPLGSETKSPKLWILPNYWRIPPSPKNDHISPKNQPALLSRGFFLLPRSNMLVPWRVNLQPLLLSRLSPDRLQDMALQRPDRRNLRFCLQNNSIGFCLPMFRLTLPVDLLRWNQVPSSFGGLKLTQTIWRDQNKRGICYDQVSFDCLIVEQKSQSDSLWKVWRFPPETEDSQSLAVIVWGYRFSCTIALQKAYGNILCLAPQSLSQHHFCASLVLEILILAFTMQYHYHYHYHYYYHHILTSNFPNLEKTWWTPLN